MPTPDERIQTLVARGIMPSEAEQIVTDSDARGGRLLTESEAELYAVPDDAGMQADRLWPYFTPDIPVKYKRLWTARVVND